MNKCKNVGAHDCAQQGITLIALVITIIVMLILVAVTISMAINGGLFEYAGKATGDTKNAIDKEQELANGKIQVDGVWSDSIDDYIKGIESEDQNGGTTVEIPTDLKVGDYVNYTPTEGTYKVADGTNGSGYTTTDGYQTFTTETGDSALKWRVLSIDETTGEVELVAATQSSSVLYLKGSDGYNHSVDILNDLCKTLYSNTSGATARSINVEDINAKTTYDYTTYTTYTVEDREYGDTLGLKSLGYLYMQYPNLYCQEIGFGLGGNYFNSTGLSGSEGKKDGVTDANAVTTYNTVTGNTNGYSEGTDPYITYTYYYYDVENYLNTNLGVNTAPEGLIRTGTTYWLASRCVRDESNGMWHLVFWGPRTVDATGFLDSGVLLSCSVGNSKKVGSAVRPVVALSANATLTKDTTNSTGTTTYWNIEF